MAAEVPQTLEYKGGQLDAAPILEDTRSGQEYMNDLKEEYQARALLAKSKRFFKKEVSSDDNEMVEVKVLMALDEENDAVSKKGARNVCSTPLPRLEKLDGTEPLSGLKTIKLILKLKSTFKVEALKGVIRNEPSSAPAKGNKSALASKVNSTPTGRLKNVKIKDDPHLAIVIKELNNLKLKISKNQSSYSRFNQPQQFDEKRGTIFSSNKEVVMISPRISGHLSSPNVEDTSVQDTVPISNSSLSIPFMTSLAPQDRWSQDKHVELVNIIGDPGAGMLTRAMAKELNAVSAHECLFVDFLSKEEPKKWKERRNYKCDKLDTSIYYGSIYSVDYTMVYSPTLLSKSGY
uniref:Retrovirus-related Pol polyprotein from transposon TNT 1-94 n=1 Tax=Tanacetum cinerariifolium TaxID=118510 RepID=A0A6L2MPL3_TANCI|nr:retrovirus-related Pol polyprotein from transposon TNT 1-94 [Tanacetum cinerariifolium]